MDGDARRSIGYFETPDEAAAAYEAAKKLIDAKRPPPWHTVQLTAERLREIVSYDPQTGEFTRIGRCGVKDGLRGGGVNKDTGYHTIRIDGHRYPAHRIAWLYMTGAFPDQHIDHKDGDKANNRFNNLRQATRAENAQNYPARSSNTSGLRGVSWHRAQAKFQARIMVNRKQHSLGYFGDPIEAHKAYLEAKSRLHTFQPIPRDLD